MSSKSEWIKAVLTKSQERDIVVPDVVWTQVETLLQGKLSERELPAGELAIVANKLIEAMNPALLVEEEVK